MGVRVAGLSVISLGQVPNSGSTTFDATPIVRDLLGPLAPACKLTAEAVAPLTGVLGAGAEPVVSAVEGVAGPLPVTPERAAPEAPAAPPASAQAAAPAPAATPAAPFHGPVLPEFTPFALGQYHSSLPAYSYAALLVGRPGAIGRLQTGMLNSGLFGTSAPGSLTAQNPAANDVAAAGRAEALPTSNTERIALPVLVAVLMLAAVSAALIRGWVVVTRR